ncbi:MAG: bifunctional 5,10-methylenetetrahydrofolate dehydrogenase/5,10-methenyltetrahydrofolate cyclohydrolase [Holosporales bacterium]|jgi:methylenetetrahydrofolate dehydrogenase (NADP+)/methenyltetrahydrofolate cyclohydrolase|nr:bifunctional 5,10-methylenetetrahydrofolate dehydrogenase/5,10-methenyltetrahydrofolate cyclohydrolase [Holosporales bacterium]
MPIIRGKHIADKMCIAIKARTQAFVQQYGKHPTLALIRVGNDPASIIYVRNKVQRAQEIGICSQVFELPADMSSSELGTRIKTLNANSDVHGILVQLPLPASLDTETIIDTISPQKDVDGLTTITQGNLFRGTSCLKPCTAQGIVTLLKTVHSDLSGKHAVILGRSLIVGRSVGLMLLHEDCTITLVHSRSHDIAALCKRADIVVAAVGKPHFVTRSFIKEGATVIDVGISRVLCASGTSKIVGDVDFNDVSSVAGFITPVPGGVGPMTVGCLMQNTIEAAENQMKAHHT